MLFWLKQCELVWVFPSLADMPSKAEDVFVLLVRNAQDIDLASLGQGFRILL